jgi:hypothetical protein
MKGEREMAKYQRRPNTFIPFEANQYLGDGLTLGMRSREDGSVYVKTIQGRDVDVSPGEWIIQEPDGDHYYPCSDSIFRERYELSPE